MKIYQILAVSLAFSIASGESPAHRTGRTLPFLPSFRGPTPALNPPTEPFQIPSNSRYPIWRVHKYHGIDLRPIPEAAPVLQTHQPTGFVAADLGTDQYETAASETAAETIGNLPADLRNLAEMLGFDESTRMSSVDDIIGLLGTGSRQETIEMIRDLAKSSDGIDLMKTVVESIQSEEQHVDDADDLINNVEESRVSSRKLIPPGRFSIGSGTLLDRTDTDLSLLRTAVPSLPSDSGLFDRLTSWLSYLRTPDNTAIPFRPLNKDLENLDGYRRRPDSIAIANLPPLAELPGIRGIPNLPSLQPPNLPALHIPRGRPLHDRTLLPFLPTQPAAAQQLFNRFNMQQLRQRNEFALANRQLARLPLVNRNRDRFDQSAINSYGSRINQDFAASEQKPVRLDAPQSATMTSVEKSFSSSSSSSNSSLGPQRISAVDANGASVSGRIFTADPNALNLPIDRNVPQRSSTEIEASERRLIENVAELTSGERKSNKDNDDDKLQ